MRGYLYQIRPVLFLFYLVETVINLIIMHFHLTGFIFMDLEYLPLFDELTHYFYLLCFYTFTVLTMFASVAVCTGNRTSIMEEVIRPLAGFFIYMICSLMTLADAELDYYLMHSSSYTKNSTLPQQPAHPYMKHMRAQALASLVGGIVYLLHGLIALDVLLSHEDSDSEAGSSSDDHARGDYVPVRLYVLGSRVEEWLEQYQWFRDFTRQPNPTI
ncbi:hypothetical protein KR018_005935 [Drosophila ironensis]|nr:hypothetical protein KR018_005935 [Drosophila ironensis]